MPVAKDGFIFIFLIGNEHTEITLPNACIPCVNKSGKVHKISKTKTLYFLTIQNMAAIGRNCLCSNNETSKQKRGVRMWAVCSIHAWLSPSPPQLGKRTARYDWPKQRSKKKKKKLGKKYSCNRNKEAVSRVMWVKSKIHSKWLYQIINSRNTYSSILGFKHFVSETQRPKPTL